MPLVSLRGHGSFLRKSRGRRWIASREQEEGAIQTPRRCARSDSDRGWLVGDGGRCGEP